MISKLLRTIVSNKVLRKKAVDLLRKINQSAFDISGLNNFSTFIDENGNSIQLKEGLRSMIKPGWQETFNEKPISELTLKEIETKSKEIEYFVMLMNETLTKLANRKFEEVLEIGSFDSIKSALLAKKWPDSIIKSSDIDYYYDEFNLEQIKKNRNLVHHYFGVTNLSFDVDDIMQSNYKDNSFDLVFSSDVLEHISDISKCFKELYRITKPGGYGYHVYNPFFSYNGGHTYATLDFPWGHASLSSEDFKKYLRTYRAHEFDIATKFYFNNLNRCTLKNMNNFILDSGFEVLTILKEIKTNQLKMLNHNTLSMIQNIYPEVTLEDLLAPIVTVIVKKNI